ncbi:MAG TPA: glucuronate isomerase [Polyangiaceae bacterium]|jgi:glucuronate isomerase|nr:glucuronate isomerase [Polyangiaceae bacterium]
MFDEDFLLETDTARDLYESFARPQPIIDYHCHLPPAEVATNHQFRSITGIWLDGDHYKWRAMRTNGVAERLCTGDATDFEKFQAWAGTVPRTLRNPLFHWTGLELKNPFGIKQLLNEATAREIFDACNESLKKPEFFARGLLEHFNVAVVCTTDDPADSLEHHQSYAASAHTSRVRMYPTFRPDKALRIEQGATYNAYVDSLEAVSGQNIRSYGELLAVLSARHQAFHELGCRASDHGLDTVYADDCTPAEVSAVFARARGGAEVSAADALKFKSALLHELALLDHERGWVQQFHLGAMRNNNSRLFRALGPDTGFDSIGDFGLAASLARFLDRLDDGNRLAKTILYNSNPRDNEVLATLIGSFQDGSVPGKMQFGSGWWFLDQLDGMERQLNALSNMGLLSRFVGMLTDSRSFLSYSRHEYFRRLLCNLLGHDVRRGLIPNDRALLGELVTDLCFRNANNYLGLGLPERFKAHA